MPKYICNKLLNDKKNHNCHTVKGNMHKQISFSRSSSVTITLSIIIFHKKCSNKKLQHLKFHKNIYLVANSDKPYLLRINNKFS